MKKIILLLSVLILMAGLVSCNGSGDGSGSSNAGDGGEGSSPMEQTDLFLQAVKAKDSEMIRAVYAGGDFQVLPSGRPDSEDEYTEIYDIMEKKVLDFDYALANESIDGDTATVDVEITTYKIGKALTAFMKDLILEAFTLEEDMSDEEIEELILANLSSTLEGLEKKNHKETVTLSLSLEDDIWVVDELEEEGDFYDALTGGSYDFSDELTETFGFE